MHFVLSYDLGADGARRSELEEQIQSIISPYRNVKRLLHSILFTSKVV